MTDHFLAKACGNACDDLALAAAPIERAQGLPNWLYREEAAFQAERESIFANNWSGIGFARDVPQKGDVKPIDIFGENLLLVRDRDGRIRVFHNVCRHRGVVLVAEAHNSTGLLRCPYHAWCYDLNGRLRQTPHAGGPGIHAHETIEKEWLGLKEVRSCVFHDVVFVNLSGDAVDFETRFAELMRRWRDFDRPQYSGGADSIFTLDLNCNWKLAVENYCESYHLPFVHPGLNAYSRLEDHENILGDGYAGQLTRVYAPQLAKNGREFANFKDISKRWQTNAEYIAVYPNVLFGVHRDHVYAILLEPVSLRKTIEHVSIYYASEEMLGRSYRTLRQRNAQLWKAVFIEDIVVVESMQRGRSGTGFDGGHFSPVMDEATHHFHSWVANSLQSAAAI